MNVSTVFFFATENIDDCDPDPCANGQCVDGINSYECNCDSGYNGANCDGIELTLIKLI